jgi:signal transduction histidine kinase/CheY-like chemotaxis protein
MADLSGLHLETTASVAGASATSLRERELFAETQALEILNRTGTALAAELDLERIVQLVTDAATTVSRAEFGAFFYNVTDEAGERYTLYTLSGAPREAFASFPMPRNTAVFSPTFRGESIVRSDDILKHPDYGKSAPHYGMPEGHLPVRSYLAVPVVSRSGEVVGGLFFGHEETGVFTDQAERLVAGIAAQAAIAIDNARLYEAAQHEIRERTRVEGELRRVNETLEERVADRTWELAAANSRLTAEMASRERTEAALRQAQKMEAVGQLTGGVAHDFNNLLTVISGNLDLIRRTRDEARRTALIENAQRAAERGARLNQQLLAFARRQSLRPVHVDLNRQLGEFATLLDQAVGETVEVETDLAPDLWTSHVDLAQFEAAVLNLAVNARDAMPEGGRLHIETRNVTVAPEAQPAEHVPPGDYVAVRVSDNGVGIPPEIRDRVVEPFFTTKGQGKGSGLGLSQVYGFVRQSGGYLDISSEPGAGTAVSMYLPRSHGRVPRGAVAGERASGAAGESILVVEDNTDVRAVVVAMLEDLGYRVFSAANGTEAVDILQRDGAVDVVFTDIVMPQGPNGLDVAREARRLRPDAKVLLTSGFSGDIEFGEGEDWRVLQKPFRPADLARALRGVLDEDGLADPTSEADGPAPAEPAAALGSVASAQTASERKRILIVEDEALILMAAEDMLTQLGHAVLTANNAKAAMAALAGGDSVDAMLTDVNLPDMDGCKLAEEARRLRPRLPVVFVTGYRMNVPDDIAGTGPTTVLGKPYWTAELDKALRQVL